MSKPREWECWYSPEENELKSGGNYGCTDGWEWVSVIEKSAYEELKAALKNQIEMLKSLNSNSNYANLGLNHHISYTTKKLEEVLSRHAGLRT